MEEFKLLQMFMSDDNIFNSTENGMSQLLFLRKPVFFYTGLTSSVNSLSRIDTAEYSII